MRKEALLAIIVISLFILVSASVWEGAADLGGDLPETGLYIATNSLPINTVVDVINLENGKFARLVVSTGLNNSGYLALLSRDAASALGIEKGSLSRIRLSHNPDPLAFSRFNMDPGARAEYDDFTLVPDRPRPPEGGPVPDPSQFVAGYVPPPQETSQPIIDTSLVIEPVRETPLAIEPVRVREIPPAVEPVREIPPAVEPVLKIPVPAPASAFSAPMISSMERGMYYVQIAAYSNPESVEYEITRRIDNSLPVVIMDAGTVERPIYRVLIGPLDFGESNAILERYISIYKDAFVWHSR